MSRGIETGGNHVPELQRVIRPPLDARVIKPAGVSVGEQRWRNIEVKRTRRQGQ